MRFYIGNPSYYVNNQQYTKDAALVVLNSRTLLPIKYVASPLGAAVSWNDIEQKVTIVFGTRNIELWINQNTARVNGTTVMIDPYDPNVVSTVVPPGRTMLPLRFIGENLGCKVDWDPVQQIVTVIYPQ